MIASLYRVLLHVYPRAFRERYGEQMTAAFSALAAERRALGGWRALALLLAETAVDVVSNASAAHRSERIRRRPCVSVHGQRSPARSMVDGMRSDLRFAWRSILARPGVAASVVLTLTVGTGAATAIFSVVDAVLLRPLPYPDDERLVTIAERQPLNPLASASFSGVFAWQELPALTSLAAYTMEAATFNAGVEPERVNGAMVSPEFFEVLRVKPLVGRTFHSGDRLFDPDRKIVLSHAVWMRRFSGDAAVIGRQVALDSGPHTIVGVMPRGFAYPANTEFWASLSPDMASVKELKDVRFLQTIGRLAPWAALTALQAQLNEVAARRAPQLPAAQRTWMPHAQTLREQTIGTVRRPLVLVLGAVGLLTVVGCCNAAAMLLARGAVRSRELAVRCAIGASRGRIVRQLLLESLIIACCAALLGTVAAWWMLNGIAALSLGQVPRIDTLEMNARVLGFVAVFTIAVAALFGIAPAVALSRVNPAQVINAARSGGDRQKARGLRLLVVLECTMALVMLAGGGLLVNSFVRLTRVDTGIDPANVLTAKVSVPVVATWRGDAVRRRLHLDLLARVARLPDVRAVAVTSRLPLSEVRGGGAAGTQEEPAKIPRAVQSVVSEDFFTTLGARLLAGRVFTPIDDDKAPKVAVVNQALAAALWPGEDAVGRTLIYRHYLGPLSLTVVGVVAPIRYDGLTSDYKPEIFTPLRQSTVVPLQLVVRTASDPMDVVPAIRMQLAHVDPTDTVTIDAVSTIERQLASTTARPRFFAALLGTFAAAALLLAALGVHGVLSFWTEQRQREFGVRVALGATRAELYRQVIGQGVVLAVAGVGIGLAVSVAASRLVAGLLYGITTSDIGTYVGVSTLLLAAAIAACLPAARRAASVDPVQMLRAG